MNDSTIESVKVDNEPRQRELLDKLWQGLDTLRNLERKYPSKYKGTDTSAHLDSLISDIKSSSTAELGDNEKKEQAIHLAATLKELREYVKTNDIKFPRYARDVLNKETQKGLWCLYHVFNASLDKQLPPEIVETLEEKSLNTVLNSFSLFRELPIPATQVRGPLPITPTQEIYEKTLKEFMENFLEHVWKDALGDASHCLFLDLCIWDPFRLYSKDNWALTNSGINNLEQGVMEGFYRSQENITFSLLYQSLKKEVLVIAVPPEVQLKKLTKEEREKLTKEEREKLEKPYILDAVPEDYITSGIAEANAAIKREFEAVINAHKHFRSDRNIYIHYIPSLFYPKDSGTGIGGLILISKTTFQRKTLVRFQTVLDSILSKIGVYHLFENFFDQSVRSAVSSVMARNMSHNIGSHVIPRATVEAIRRRISELRILHGEGRENIPASKNSEIVLDLVTTLKGKLDEYTQRKSDFLAEITTEPLMTTRPAFFYREVILPFVENTLLMDNLAANEGIQYVDSLKNRLKIRVNINGKELRARYQCRFCVETGQHGEYIYPEGLPYSLNCTRHPNKRLELCDIENGEQDVEVELPGPLGEFAFYSFMENDIRNSAKHNKECIGRNDDLVVHIDISDPINKDNLNFYYVKIWNNVVEPSRRVQMNVNGKSYKVLWEAISALADSKIIQPDGSLKRQAWGIAEMKICAVLLRGPKDFAEALNQKDHNEHESRKHLEVLNEEIDGAERLVYQFRLMKSRKICAVLPQFGARIAASARDTKERVRNQQEFRDKLKRDGIWLFDSMDELENALDKDSADGQSQVSGTEGVGQRDISSIASFRFVILDCSGDPKKDIGKMLEKLTNNGTPHSSAEHSPAGSTPQEFGECILPKLPFRVLALVGRESSAGDSIIPDCVVSVFEDFSSAGLFEMSANEMYQWAWSHWMNRWLGNDRKLVVNIYLDQREDEEPTSRWVKHARSFNKESGRVKLDVFGWRGDAVESLTEVQTDDQCINIIYDRHRQLSSKLSHQLTAPPEWAYMLLEKHSPDFTTLFSPKFPAQESEIWTLPWELAEAGLLKILVIDERAAEFSMEELDDDPTRRLLEKLVNARYGSRTEQMVPVKWHMAWATNTYICTHFGYEQEPTALHNRIADRKDNFPPYLRINVRERGSDLQLSVSGKQEKGLRADAVLIHQGVIDDCGSRIAGFNQDKFLDLLRKEFPFVVVESGRGIPPTLSEREKFLPFSRLQHSILGNIVGKFGLSKVLMSLARRVRD